MVDVGFITNDDLPAAWAMCEQAGEVAHRPARDKNRGVLADTLRRPALEFVHGRVVSEPVVAHIGTGHGGSHCWCGASDRVGAEIDDLHRR